MWRRRCRTGQWVEKTNERLARFAYIASHDLQEPLRKLVAFSEFLEEAIAAADRSEIAPLIFRSMGRHIHKLAGYYRPPELVEAPLREDSPTIEERSALAPGAPISRPEYRAPAPTRRRRVDEQPVNKQRREERPRLPPFHEISPLWPTMSVPFRGVRKLKADAIRGYMKERGFLATAME